DCLAQQHVLETRYLQATLTRKDPRTTETRASRMRKNPTLERWVVRVVGDDAGNRSQGGAHAGRRSAAGGDVELHFARTAGPGRPSLAPAASHGGWGHGRAVGRIRQAVFPGGPAVDRAREVAPRAAAAGAVQRA